MPKRCISRLDMLSTGCASRLPLRPRVERAVAGLLFVGSTFGGQLGAVIGRRLPPVVLRTTIVVVGTAVAIKLLVT